jgi:hypothetical protein
MNDNFGFNRLVRACASWSVAAVLASSCAADTAWPGDDMELPEQAQLLASLSLSETHTVNFYDLGNGHSIVAETLNVDRDPPSTLAGTGSLRTQGLGNVYSRLAGSAADPGDLARLRAFDAAYPMVELSTEASHVAGNGVRDVAVAPVERWDELADKSLSSDAHWFADHWCNGCLGYKGSRVSGQPTDVPVCTNAPEYCVSGFSSASWSTYSYCQYSVAYNEATSGNATYASYLDDPCEHDSWWSRTFSVCKEGARLFSVSVPPRSVSYVYDDQTAKWHRSTSMSGSLIGFGIDLYDVRSSF